MPDLADLIDRWTQRLANKRATILGCETSMAAEHYEPNKSGLRIARSRSVEAAAVCEEVLAVLRSAPNPLAASGWLRWLYGAAQIEACKAALRRDLLRTALGEARELIAHAQGAETAEKGVVQPTDVAPDQGAGAPARHPGEDGDAPVDTQP